MNTRLPLLVRLRAVGVAAFSGAAALAGHGLGGGGTAISERPLMLLVAVCAIPAFLVTSKQVRGGGHGSLIGMLLLGQGFGHLVLSVDHAGHLGGHTPSPAMLAGHVTAAVGAAVLIRCLEGLTLVALGVLGATTRRPVPLPGVTPQAPTVDRVGTLHPARGTWQAFGGTRAPPLCV